MGEGRCCARSDVSGFTGVLGGRRTSLVDRMGL